MDIRISPPDEMIEVTIDLPLSKSMYNRALVMGALTPGGVEMPAAPPCADATVMARALPVRQGTVDAADAGTAMRFLTAYYAAMDGTDVTLDGCERMRQRPIGDLVDALRALGADIEYAGAEGYPPLHIRGHRLRGGEVTMRAGVSSQFVSALLMVAPTFQAPLTLRLDGEPSSLPYIKMTVGMMCHRGIRAELYANTLTVDPGVYCAPETDDIERDWSAASYWYSIAALSTGWITLPGLSLDSLQGDSRVAEYFEKLGVVTTEEDGEICLSASPEVFSRLDTDLSDTPDVAQTLAVACCMLGVPFHFSGLESLKIKETDRIAALKAELAKLSFDIEVVRDGEIRWEGQRVPVTEVQSIDVWGDHRMAMSFAPVAIFVDGLVIKDSEVVSKSYPNYWDDMRKAGFLIQEPEG